MKFDFDLTEEFRGRIASRINQVCDEAIDLVDGFLRSLLQTQGYEPQQVADYIRFIAVKYNYKALVARSPQEKTRQHSREQWLYRTLLKISELNPAYAVRLSTARSLAKLTAHYGSLQEAVEIANEAVRLGEENMEELDDAFKEEARKSLLNLRSLVDTWSRKLIALVPPSNVN